MVSTDLLVTAVLSVLGVAGAGVAYYYYYQYREQRLEDFEAYLDELDDGEPAEFKPPDVSGGLWSLVGEWWHKARAKRAAKKGYVKWYRLDSTLSSPEWVKPEQDGSGVPKVTQDSQPYYFPKESMVADERTGAWVAMHREGEGDPINLRDPAYPGMETDLVERTINLEAEDKPPGLFDNLFGDMDQQTMMYAGIAVLFVVYAAYRYMGGAM